MNKRPSTAKVEVQIRVADGDGFSSDIIAETELSERVVLAAQGSPFDPVVGLLEHITREAVNKTTAQVTAFDHLSEAQADTSAPPA